MTNVFLKRVMPAAMVLTGVAWQAAAADAKLDPKQLEFFEKNVRPVLVSACYDCHSPNAKVKGNLVVDSKEGLLKGGDSGPAVVPGNPKKSLLIEAIEYHNKDLKMPPKEENRLTDEQVANLVAWVQMGAPDPRGGAAPAMKAISIEESRSHWAFQPIKNPPVPKVSDKSGFVKTDVDRFILAKLKENGLTPSPALEKRELIRRAAYDLIGLPPTPEEVEDFIKDKSPNAFAKVVDRYLASPRYGERWGRHWLDVARYADNTGDRLNRGTPNYPFAWTYRDYVIDAFNKDKPFNQFILEQLAADRVVKGDDKRDMAAMGYLTVGKRFMGNQDDVIDDRIDVVTQGFMALTVSCARCHDHKFDPIPTKDYYSLYGVFNSSTEPEVEPVLTQPKDTPEYRDFVAKHKELDDELADTARSEYEKSLTQLRTHYGDILLGSYRYGSSKNNPALRSFLRENSVNANAFEELAKSLKKMAKEPGPVMKPWFDYAALSKEEFSSKAGEITAALAKDTSVNPLVAGALSKAEPKSIDDVAAAYGKLFSRIEKNWVEARSNNAAGMKDEYEEQIRLVMHDPKSPLYLNTKDARTLQLVGGAQIRNFENRVQNKIYTLETTHPGSPARAMVMQDVAKPRDAFVLVRGEKGRRGDPAPRQFLQILSTAEPKKLNTGSGRIDLAEAIADRNNPLTARVIVNRVWAKHFGEGLVRTISDFGLRAEQPKQLELLDHLATWFMDNGWSIKKLHRYIMLSGVYQQGAKDNNQYEEKDPSNEYLWKMPIHRLDFEAIRDTVLMHGGNLDLTPGGKPVDITENPSPNRRTVYGRVDRFALPEMFRTFDFANPDMTTSVRNPTTVPQQALFMMNSPFVIEQAKLMVQRTDFLARKSDEEKVKFLFQTLFQRDPTKQEVSMSQQYLTAQAGKEVKPDAGKADWAYGNGYYDPKTKQVRFRPMTEAAGNSYVSGIKKAGTASLNAAGGMPGSSSKFGVIRRWTAPKDGRVFISGPILHRDKEGDGIEARIVGSRAGELGNWNVQNSKQDVTIEHVDVKAGDTIDFIVDCRSNDEKDRFIWIPVIRMEDGPEWNARAQFTLPDKSQQHTPLNSWEKLAQALFLTNELIYVN